jgi:hypothetical protein
MGRNSTSPFGRDPKEAEILFVQHVLTRDCVSGQNKQQVWFKRRVGTWSEELSNTSDLMICLVCRKKPAGLVENPI